MNRKQDVGSGRSAALRRLAQPPETEGGSRGGRHALTLWQKLKVENGNSLIKLTPITGRSHQLRVHMLELGHPILGDNLYAQPGCAGGGTPIFTCMRPA